MEYRVRSCFLTSTSPSERIYTNPYASFTTLGNSSKITPFQATENQVLHQFGRRGINKETPPELLKDRLKCFFENHSIRTVKIARYRLSLARNGGKAPLILKDGVSPTELPEHFQKVSIDPDTTAIRETLEQGGKLNFAVLTLDALYSNPLQIQSPENVIG
jgi:hypothetical protein